MVNRPSPRTVALGGSVALVLGAATLYMATQRRQLPYALVFDSQTHEPHYVVQTLYTLENDAKAMHVVQRELAKEWGAFGPANMDEMRRMVENAGHMIYVMRVFNDGNLAEPAGVLQTGLADVHGDPEQLVRRYRSFNDITSDGTWRESRRMRGDTALLLQITSFGERSVGVGSRLRDAALYMLPNEVKYALTTTPVDDPPTNFDIKTPAPYTPAMKFHGRGGATPTMLQEGFKVPIQERAHLGTNHGTDVVFMRYQRGEDGGWEGVKKPEMAIYLESRTNHLPLSDLSQRLFGLVHR